jgi:hypothetical protein
MTIFTVIHITATLTMAGQSLILLEILTFGCLMIPIMGMYTTATPTYDKIMAGKSLILLEILTFGCPMIPLMVIYTIATHTEDTIIIQATIMVTTTQHHIKAKDTIMATITVTTMVTITGDILMEIITTEVVATTIITELIIIMFITKRFQLKAKQYLLKTSIKSKLPQCTIIDQQSCCQFYFSHQFTSLSSLKNNREEAVDSTKSLLKLKFNEIII